MQDVAEVRGEGATRTARTCIIICYLQYLDIDNGRKRLWSSINGDVDTCPGGTVLQSRRRDLLEYSTAVFSTTIICRDARDIILYQ